MIVVEIAAWVCVPDLRTLAKFNGFVLEVLCTRVVLLCRVSHFDHGDYVFCRGSEIPSSVEKIE